MSRRKKPEEEKQNKRGHEETGFYAGFDASSEDGRGGGRGGKHKRRKALAAKRSGEKRFRLDVSGAAKFGASRSGEKHSGANSSGARADFRGESGNDFGAMIRSAEPVLKLTGDSAKGAWKKDILLNVSVAALLMALFGLFCMSFYEPVLIAFSAPCAVIFLLLSMLESIKPGKAKWIAAAVIAVIAAVAAAVWHTRIFGGLAFIMNEFYEYCEDAQAYIYPRFAMGESSSAGAARFGLAWASSVIGLLAALPPKGARRGVAAVLCSAAMLAFAYYGLIPSWVCIMIMTAALLIAASGGRLAAVFPVVLCALIVFGAMYFFDPGEIYGVSRLDENLRDRLALRSAQLESEFGDPYSDPYTDEGEQEWTDPEQEQTDPDTNVFKGEYSKYFIIGFIVLIVLLLALTGFLIFRRIARKRKKIRAGLDSSDPRVAVVAMFPYTVRWLIGCGVEVKEVPFLSLMPSIRELFSDDYAKRYASMYELWSEAAYSDHEVSAETLRDMDSFMQDTIKMADRKCSFKDKLKIRFKYAL